MHLDQLETEQRNLRTMNIDRLTTLEMLTLINEEDKTIADCVEKCIPAIAKLIDLCHERMMMGGRVIYIGAGTSGRLGVLDASECPPTYGVSPSLFQGLIAGGYEALLKAKEGAEDSEELARADLQKIALNENDTVIGLAASGRTPYVIGGLKYANEIGALTGSIACVSHAKISRYATCPIEAVTYAEVVTGSTRMKAGTAQKMILNMISTTLMIQYGKVYQNLMVDVQPTNEKLVERAKRIIQEATGCTENEANHYLEASGQDVKLAICMYLTKKDKATCAKLLADHHGNVAQVIHEFI